ncbi:hypothetical protein RRG08_002311 [Elysia crispata]|uniref:Uncharacterized protein n=1 Tax=Elysia crispata TaxID=231223 RepID=A0AAE0ZBD8_9GAST|nr:hypothetical protein RRG08_002311 [Elysia crispata]
MIAVFLSLVFVILYLLWLYLSRDQEKNRKIPGVEPTSKEDGNLSDIRAAGGFQNYLEKLHVKLGPIVSFWYGQVYTVSIASPELFKQHLHPFDRPPLFFKLFEPLIGPASIQFANGEDGRCRRKMYDRAFAHDKFGSYYKSFQKSADAIVKRWSLKGEDDVIPLNDETYNFTVRTAMCSMLGEYCEDNDVIYGFRKAYLKAQEELSKVIGGDPSHCEKVHTIQDFNEAMDFMKKTVKLALEHHKNTTCQRTLVVDEILEYAPNDEIVLSDCLTYLIGSFHNTGNMLAVCLYYLAKDEVIQEKVYNEIVQVLGEDGLVDESNLRDLKYMHQVIDESIRCGGSGMYAARYQEADITLGGFKIPKNTPVIQALGYVMKDEKIWPLPTKFDPDRFSEENMKDRSLFAFKPFGFSGKRVCPGYKLVHPKSAVFLATVLRRFKIKLHGDQHMEYAHGLGTHSSEEIWAKLVKR